MAMLRNIIGSKLFMLILARLSPILIALLKEQIDKLEIAAGKSKNPYDDILVRVIRELVKSE